MNDPKLSELLAIAKGQTARDKALTVIGRRLYKLGQDVITLSADLDKFLGAPQTAGTDKPSAPKAKRTPIAVKAPAVAAVLDTLSTHPANALTIAQIKTDLVVPFDRLGSKTIGAALRQLVSEGKASEGPRGRWKAVDEAAEEKGADA